MDPETFPLYKWLHDADDKKFFDKVRGALEEFVKEESVPVAGSGLSKLVEGVNRIYNKMICAGHSPEGYRLHLDKETHDKFLEELQDQIGPAPERAHMRAKGFQTLSLHGIPVVSDPDLPEDSMYLIPTKKPRRLVLNDEVRKLGDISPENPFMIYKEEDDE